MEWFTVTYYVVAAFVIFSLGLGLGFWTAHRKSSKVYRELLIKLEKKSQVDMKKFFEVGYREGRWKKKGCERAYWDFLWKYNDTHMSPDSEDLKLPRNRMIG